MNVRVSMEHLNRPQQPLQKTSNQGKHREEIEKQNKAALRMAQKQQELKLERLQQEQEQLRLRTDRLKKEQALRVQELQEENWKKLAEATLTELELRNYSYLYRTQR